MTFPIALIEDRYMGSYSKGTWLAIDAADIVTEGQSRISWCFENGPGGDDTEAREFWANPPKWIAVGSNPEEARLSLAREKPEKGFLGHSIDTAPKDGTRFISWDGEWWRRDTQWGSVLRGVDGTGWYAWGYYPVHPTRWCSENEVTPEIQRNIDKGNGHV